MELALGSRFRNAWNTFRSRDPTEELFKDDGPSYYIRPDRPRLTRGNERSIVTSVITHIALDVSALTFKHCKLDDKNRYKEDYSSRLNDVLNLEANIDQSGRAFMQDCVMSLLDEGVVSLVPTYINGSPSSDLSYKADSICEMRVGKIVEWKPSAVKVKVYNAASGKHEERWFSKSNVAIIENPMYAIMNEPNSTLQRLMRKLSLLDVTDEQTASGKLDLIIQLPYQAKTEARKNYANSRVQSISDQLATNKYGIAYIDGTEKITQLNRSLENNLLKQVEYWTDLLYSQLGITKEVLDGTADEKVMQNYYSRTIEPIVNAILDELNRKFLTQTARTQKQRFMCFRDRFRLVAAADLAELADKMTRNEIMSSNEFRAILGLQPSDDPKADELVNSNISQPEDEREKFIDQNKYYDEQEEIQNG